MAFENARISISTTDADVIRQTFSRVYDETPGSDVFVQYKDASGWTRSINVGGPPTEEGLLWVQRVNPSLVAVYVSILNVDTLEYEYKRVAFSSQTIDAGTGQPFT